MSRHNREARGTDQHGVLWYIGYQPDWLSRIKISRPLPAGRRRSSLTIFRNPKRRAETTPGKVVRTDIRAVDDSVRFRVSIEDPDEIVESIIVVTRQRRGKRSEKVSFIIEAKLPPPRK